MAIDAFRLRHVADCVLEQSGDQDVLDMVLKRTGLTLKAIEPGKLVDPLAEPVFVTEACDVLSDPTFGCKAGLAFMDATNLTSYIAKHSRNLKNAITNSGRYHSLIDPAFSYSVNVSGNAASFVIECVDPEFTRFDRYKELLLFTGLSRMRMITQKRFFPMEMRFQHHVKSAAKKIEKLAEFPVVFGAEKMEMILPLPALELPVPTFDPNLRNHLMEYAERLLQEAPAQELSLKSKIKGVVVAGLPGRIASAEEVASSLGMGKRTFSRRLGEEETSYRKIVDEVRRELALGYLKDSFSVSEIAYSLDYADQAAFSTAFKRWVGCSPKDYRAQHRPSS